MNKKLIFFVAIALVLSACGGESMKEKRMRELREAKENPGLSQKVKVDPKQAGSIAGKVKFTGKVPKRRLVRMKLDRECHKQHTTDILSEDLIVNGNGTLRNAVVMISKGLEKYRFEGDDKSAQIDQVGCVYKPHVVSMFPGKIDIKNSDKTFHNVKAIVKLNKSFNLLMPNVETKTEKLLIPEVAQFVCNVHPWMRSYIVINNGPSAVTGDNGEFNLAGIPAGEYFLDVWHEKLGKQSQAVTVVAGKTAEIDFTFSN